MVFDTYNNRIRKTPPASPEMPERPVKPRLAVFGGSFDPVHNGHLFIAGSLLRQKLTEEVLLVPAGTPPHKQEGLMASPEHRLAMLKLAVEEYPGISVSDIELAQESMPAYTINTLETLTRLFRDSDIHFVIGMDSLLDIPNWHRAGELVNRHSFLVYPRPGFEPPSPAMLAPHFGPRNAEKLRRSIINLPEMPVSATMIRETVSQRQSLCGLVCDSVARYIREHKLYQDHE